MKKPLARIALISLTAIYQSPSSLSTESLDHELGRRNAMNEVVSLDGNAIEVTPVSFNQSETQLNKPSVKPATDLQAGQLQVESMIRRQKGSVDLFSKLHIDSSFLSNATLAPIQRSQADENNASSPLEWSPQGYDWRSPAFCHKPLYFEQPNLERYGTRNAPCLAPTLSAAHFFGTAALLPIKAIHLPPWCKSCTLGNRRPGDCNPIQRPLHEH